MTFIVTRAKVKNTYFTCKIAKRFNLIMSNIADDITLTPPRKIANPIYLELASRIMAELIASKQFKGVVTGVINKEQLAIEACDMTDVLIEEANRRANQ